MVDRLDPDTREHLKEIAEGYNAFYRSVLRHMSRARRVIAVLVLVQFVVGGVSIYLLDQNSNRQEETSQALADTRKALKQTRQALQEVQAQRRENIIRSCEDTNRRHDTTIRRINNVVKRTTVNATEAERAEVQRGTAGFIFIIEGLAPPVKDCVAYATKRIRPLDRRP